MTTQAVDVITVFYALKELEEVFLGPDRKWEAYTMPQFRILELYRRYKGQLNRLNHLKAKASTDWQELNRYLTSHKFEATFDGPIDGIGVVSILDMLIEWLQEAVVCEIYGFDQQSHIGFEIPESDREVYNVPGLDGPLVRIHTKSGDSLWLTMPNKAPKGPINLIQLAFTTMSERFYSAPLITSVHIPEVDLNLNSDLGFMINANTYDTNDIYWYIAKAHQQFRVRINKLGARAMVATDLEMERGIDLDEPLPLIFNKPFIGWFTQGDTNMPIAIFYADYDCWQASADLNL